LTEESDRLPDKDGIYQDDDSGYEQATITTGNDKDESEPFEVVDATTSTDGELAVSTTKTTTKIFFNRPTSDGSLEWLHSVWLACGGGKGKDEFEVFADDWKGELGYPALVKLLKGAEEKGYLAAIPDMIQPDIVTHVKLFPGCLRTLEEITERLKQASRDKPGPKTNARQITTTQEDGTRVKYDTRIGRVFNILHADSEVLADVAYGDLNQFRNTQNKRVRRRLKAELRDMMMLRGKDLPRDLYGSVCLRLGMPLPSDFWHISPERLPNYTGDA
jgi:hypothetical protein